MLLRTCTSLSPCFQFFWADTEEWNCWIIGSFCVRFLRSHDTVSTVARHSHRPCPVTLGREHVPSLGTAALKHVRLDVKVFAVFVCGLLPRTHAELCGGLSENVAPEVGGTCLCSLDSGCLASRTRNQAETCSDFVGCPRGAAAPPTMEEH